MLRILPLLLAQCIQLTNADGGEIVITAEDGPPLVVRPGAGATYVAHGFSGESRIPHPMVEWLMNCNDIVQLSGKEIGSQFATPGSLPAPPSTLLSVPLRRKQKAIGLMLLWHEREMRFRQEEIEQINAIADISRLVVANARLSARSDQDPARRTRELATLLGATNAFASAQSALELIETLCGNILQAVGSTFCRIYVLELDELVIRAACTIRPLEWEPSIGRRLSLDALPRYRTLLAAGEPMLLQAEDASDLNELEQSLIFGCTNRWGLLLPLAVRGQKLGVIELGEMRNRGKNPYSDAKIGLCRAMALQGALVLENLLAAEAAVRQNEQLTRLTQSVADGILLIDAQGTIRFANPAAEAMLGLSTAEILGRECREALRPVRDGDDADCDPNCPVRNSAAALRGPTVQVKEWIRRTDGTALLVNHTLSPYADRNGTATGLISVMRDITREEEMNRLRSDFVSLVSHEIRAPLTKIITSAELLVKLELDEATRQQMVSVLNKESKYLGHIVDEVLQSSRLDEGRADISLEPLCLGPLIEQTVDLHRSRHPDHQFETQIPAQPLFALGDVVAVQVILENLVQNAVNYSEPGTLIRVTLGERNERVVIGVIDQGIGIPKDKLAIIFERYRRYSDGSRRKVPGVGLGLYITKKLVEIQQGKIWVTSEPGLGSRFYFSLNKLGGMDGEGSDHR